jgi:acetolactate synthase regulatory subunit
MLVHLAAAVPSGQGLKQIGELALAFALSSLIGLEREWRQKSAGLRTHTLVGFGAALFLIISKYGFSDVLVRGLVVLDPSRVAAQIVSGRALPRSRYVGFAVHVVYEDGRGVLRDVLRHCTEAGFSIAEVTTHRLEHDVAGGGAVAVELEVLGQPFIEPLTEALEKVSGVIEVSSHDQARATD